MVIHTWYYFCTIYSIDGEKRLGVHIVLKLSRCPQNSGGENLSPKHTLAVEILPSAQTPQHISADGPTSGLTQRNSHSPVANVITGEDGLVDNICLPIESQAEYCPGPGNSKLFPPAPFPLLPPILSPTIPPRDPRGPIKAPHRGPGCVLVAERFGWKLPGPGSGFFSAWNIERFSEPSPSLENPCAGDVARYETICGPNDV